MKRYPGCSGACDATVLRQWFILIPASIFHGINPSHEEYRISLQNITAFLQTQSERWIHKWCEIERSWFNFLFDFGSFFFVGIESDVSLARPGSDAASSLKSWGTLWVNPLAEPESDVWLPTPAQIQVNEITYLPPFCSLQFSGSEDLMETILNCSRQWQALNLNEQFSILIFYWTLTLANMIVTCVKGNEMGICSVLFCQYLYKVQ